MYTHSANKSKVVGNTEDTTNCAQALSDAPITHIVEEIIHGTEISLSEYSVVDDFLGIEGSL